MGKDHANFSVPDSCISAYDERHKALGKLVLFSKLMASQSRKRQSTGRHCGSALVFLKGQLI